VPFIRAEGSTHHVFFVIAKKFGNGDGPIEATLFHEPKRGPKLYYIFNKTGNVCTSAFAAMVRVVADAWKLESPGLRHYVWLDNLQAHCEPTTLLYALERDIVVLFLPKCTTHLFQPLDQFPFALLKKYIADVRRKKALEALLSGNSGRLTNDDAVQSAIDYFSVWLAPSVIIRSFRECGLYAFNAPKILKLARENIGFVEAPTLNSEVVAVVSTLREMLSPPRPAKKLKLNVEKDVAYTSAQLIVRSCVSRRCEGCVSQSIFQALAATQEAERVSAFEVDVTTRRDRARAKYEREMGDGGGGGGGVTWPPDMTDDYWVDHCFYCCSLKRTNSIAHASCDACGHLYLCNACGKSDAARKLADGHIAACEEA